MYHTCLFCNGDLGRNEVVEHFPVGRRLAFDAAKGRLWVVCTRCGRWNLTPVEERWEAIEEAERVFRETRTRVSTDNVGLARVREGLELVRIGAPQREEFAAWRYGDQFGRRLRNTILWTTGAVAVGGVLFATGAWGALKAVIPGGGLMFQIPNWINIYRTQKKVVARVPQPGGEQLVVRLKHARHAQIVRAPTPGDWRLFVRHEKGSSELEGELARYAAARVLAGYNHMGAGKQTVRSAVGRIDRAGGPEGFVLRHAHDEPEIRSRSWDWAEGSRASIPKGALARVNRVDRLALEMAVHEESERRALQGELAALEEAWKEAEEIAAIADDLLLPASVDEKLKK